MQIGNFMGMPTISRKAPMKKLALIFAAMVFSVTAFARSSQDEIFQPSPSPTPGDTTTAPTQFPTYIPPAPAPAPLATPATNNASINPAANQGKQSQDSGAGANAAAGAALMAAGMALMANPPTQPAGAALIAMGALALAQSGHDSGAADQSGATAAASYNGVNGSNSAVAANPNLGKGTSSYLANPALKQGTAALTDAGYSLTPAGLVSPNGTLTPNSAFNSSSGMAAAGMDAGTIAQVQSALAKVNADSGKAKVSTVALAEGGGAGGTAGNPTGGSDFSFASAKGRNPFGLSDAEKRKLVAGKTVSFDGDPIGVSGQNIFDMIHVAYQKKRDRKDFIGDELAGGPSLRSPASAAAKATSLPKLKSSGSPQR
jgi:hypothetical protein